VSQSASRESHIHFTLEKKSSTKTSDQVKKDKKNRPLWGAKREGRIGKGVVGFHSRCRHAYSGNKKKEAISV